MAGGDRGRARAINREKLRQTDTEKMIDREGKRGRKKRQSYREKRRGRQRGKKESTEREREEKEETVRLSVEIG